LPNFTRRVLRVCFFRLIVIFLPLATPVGPLPLQRILLNGPAQRSLSAVPGRTFFFFLGMTDQQPPATVFLGPHRLPFLFRISTFSEQGRLCPSGRPFFSCAGCIGQFASLSFLEERAFFHSVAMPCWPLLPITSRGTALLPAPEVGARAFLKEYVPAASGS